MADKVMKFKIEATDNASPAFARLATAVDKAKQKLDELDRKKADPKITVDSTAAQTRVQALRDALAELKNQRVRVDVDMGTAKADVGDLRQQLAFLRDVNIRIRVNTGSAKTEVTSIANRLQQLRDTDVRVDLNSGGAEGKLNRLQTKLSALRQMSPLRIDIQLDGDQHALDRLTALQTAASALAATRPNIQVTADTAAALAQLTAVHAKLTQIAGANHHIRLDTNALTVLGELSRIQSQLNRLAGGRIRLTADTRQLMVDLADARRELNRLKLMDPSPQVTADTAVAEQRVRDLELQLFRIAGRQYDARIKVDVDKPLKALGTLTKAFAAAGAGIMALGSLPAIASLGASLVTAAGSAWLLPGALAAGATGFIALKIGADGFGDAIKNIGDPKKFAESIKSLAPSARETAVAVRDLKPAFDALQLDVQGKLFTGLGTSVRQLGTSYMPILRDTYGQVATAANTAATGILDVLKSTSRMGDMKSIGASTVSIFTNLSAAVKPLTGAFVNLAAVGTSVFADMTSGAGAAAQRFAEFIQKARESGQLATWMKQGVDALKQLGSVAGNIGSILGGVFRAAQSSGADFLSTLQRITTEVRNWVNSAQGQETLANAFRAIREAVDAAWPGVQAIGSALADLVNKIATSGALTQLGEAFTKLAQTVGPMASALGGLAISAIGPLASALGALAPILGPVAVGLAGVWAAAKLMSGITAITPLITSFVTSLTTAGTAAASGGLMNGLKTLAGALGTGGLLGVALGAAGIALGIWASSQGDAAQKVAEHQAAVSNLAGTLDKFTGAATAATRAKQADEVATRTLSDGHTTLGAALRAAGISTSDFVDATTGVPGALEKVNGQLHEHAKAAIQSDVSWSSLSDKWKNTPGLLDLVTDAALGNVQAQEKLEPLLRDNATELGGLVIAAKQVIGPLGEIGTNLGDMSGQFSDAQKQAREAGAAAKDFGEVLGSLKAGLGGIKDGIIPTQLMAAGLRDLTVSASAAAAKAGEQAKAWGGISEGAKAAETSMAASRKAFVDAAIAAGQTEAGANALANSIGLIPSAAKTIFETNATGVQAELITLGAQVAAVPGAKQITVSTLSEDAQAKLRDLGFTVTTLPDGQVKVDVKDEAGRQKLQAFLAFSGTQVGMMLLDANPALANGKVDTTVQLANGKTGVVTIDGNTAPVDGKITGSVKLADGSTGTVTIDGNQTPVDGKIKATVRYADGSTGTITLNPKDLVTPAIDGIPKTGSTLWTITYKQVTVGAAPTGAVRGSVSVGVAPAGGGVIGYAGGGIAGPIRASRGYVVPGYSPGRDTVPAILSRGEAVLVPELVRRLGARRILAANAEASGGRRPAIAGNIASLMDGALGRGVNLRKLAQGRAGMTIDDFARGSGGITRLDVIAQPARQHGVAAAVAAGMRAVAVQMDPGRGRAELAAGMAQLQGELGRQTAVMRAQIGAIETALREARPINVNATAADPVEVAREAQLRARFSTR